MGAGATVGPFAYLRPGAQLGPHGRMVIPVAGRLSVVQRVGPDEVEVHRVGHYTFVPLR